MSFFSKDLSFEFYKRLPERVRGAAFRWAVREPLSGGLPEHVRMDHTLGVGGTFWAGGMRSELIREK